MSNETTHLNVVFLEAEHATLAPDALLPIRSTIETAVAECRSTLSVLGPVLNVTVFPGAYTGAGIIDGTGVGAFAANADWVRLAVDLREVDVASACRNLNTALRHELHHCGRMRMFGTPESSADAAVSEGLATAFERDTSGTSPAWGEYSEVSIEAWTEELLGLDADYVYRHWFFEHPDGRRWIGYRVGTYIADCATKSSGKTAAELIATPTAEILAMAGLEPQS